MLLFPLAENRPEVRYAWSGPAVLILSPDGSIGTDPLTGFFFRQTRFLSELRLEVHGERPFRCSIARTTADMLELTYVYPEVERGGGGGSGSGRSGERNGISYRGLDLHVRWLVRPASVTVRVRVTNRWQDGVLRIPLAWRIGADFATIDEAQFATREQSAAVSARPQRNGVAFRYEHPALPFETQVITEGGDWRYADGRLTTDAQLPRQQPQEFTLVARAVDFDHPITAEGEVQREERRRSWRTVSAALHAPGETPLIEITNRALDDLGSLALLDGADDEWLTPAAGVPLYLTLWGRDALTAAWQAGLFDGGTMLRDVLSCLERTQGRVVDPERDEEPGRIINQQKTDALSRIGRTPFQRYYADFASPFMFIIGLGYLYVLTGDNALVKQYWPAALRVLDWARQYGDRDGDGYLEYLTRSAAGPTHQGWKDSENAVVDHRGEPVAPPIAPCEIQGYYHVSLQYMALLAVAVGDRKRALELWRQAAELKERFNRDFWLDDDGYVAFGLDAEKRPIRALTSNGAHCLPTGIVRSDHIPRLVRRLFEPDLFSGWGIRTLSSRNPAYNPLDYHLGSVWPVENATILFGLRRYGFNERALQLTRALYDLSRLWPGGRIPECVGGYSRDELGHPGTYPRANAPQTWNQSVYVIMVQSLLGLVPYAPLRLLLVDPVLPPWLPEVTVKRLRIGAATLTLRFQRDASGESHFEVVEQNGALRIIRQPWVESFSADLWQRASGVFESVLSPGGG